MQSAPLNNYFLLLTSIKQQLEDVRACGVSQNPEVSEDLNLNYLSTLGIYFNLDIYTEYNSSSWNTFIHMQSGSLLFEPSKLAVAELGINCRGAILL
jgi:hypothetical protein